MTLTDTIRQQIARRNALLAEVAEIDREFEELREVLGVGTMSTMAAAPEPRVVAAPAVEPRGFASEPADPSAMSGFEVFDRKNDRPKEDDRVCERCGTEFVWSIGHSGRFCSRACYETPIVSSMVQAKTLAARDQAILVRLVTGPATKSQLSHALPNEPGKSSTQRDNDCANALTRLRREGRIFSSPEGWALVAEERPAEPPPPTLEEPPRPIAIQAAPSVPERRCGRCCHRFRPTKLGQYVCDGCADQPKRVTAAEPQPELEKVWSPGKDAPSLTGSVEGMGQSLSGSTFRIGGRR